MSVYPEGVGEKIQPKAYSQSQIENLKKLLPKNALIRIYGLAGVGKGTVSEMLSKVLEIPTIDTGLILRCATKVYKDLDIETNDKNTELVFSKINISTDKEGIVFTVDEKKVERSELKNKFIDSHVSIYAQNSYIRAKFDEALNDLVVNKLNSASIFDGRGSHEPYLIAAEKSGINVIRILVDCDIKTKAERYVQSVIDKKKLEEPDYSPTGDQMQELYSEFERTTAERDQNDIRNIIEKGIGLISEDSGILDTTHQTPEEALESALNFIESRI